MPTEEELKTRIKQYSNYPPAITLDFCMLREITINFYDSVKEGKRPELLAECIYSPQPSVTAILPLSLSLFGYYSENHISFRTKEKGIQFYPVYLSFDKLKKKEFEFHSKDNTLNLIVKMTCEHSPTEENYWHFQIKENVTDIQSRQEILVSTLSHGKQKELAKRMLNFFIPDAVIYPDKCNMSLYEYKKSFFDETIAKK